VYLKYGKCLILSALHPISGDNALGTPDSSVEPRSESQLPYTESNLIQSSSTESTLPEPVYFEDPQEINDEEADDEDESLDLDEEDLDIAWDVLEIARILFSQQLDKKSLLAETCVSLGEVSLYARRPRVGIADLQRAISIFDEIEVRNLRQIADAHYLLSMAFDFVARRLAEDPQYATAPEQPDNESILELPSENQSETVQSATEKTVVHLQLAIKFVEEELEMLDLNTHAEAISEQRIDLQQILQDLKSRLAATLAISSL
jgi:HAT1-interacting factor 1